MKLNRLGTLATTTALVSMSMLKVSAKADSSNFSGGFASFGVTATSTDVSLENNASNIPADATNSSAVIGAAFTGFETSATTILGRAKSILSNDETVASAELTLGYNIPVSDKFLVGLDVTANSGGASISKNSNYTQATVSEGTDADVVSSNAIVGATGTQTTKYEEDETFSIGIRPSYAVNDKTMVYSRLSYGQTKATLETKYSIAADSTAAKKVSDDLESYGLGLGTVYNHDKGFFVDVSVNYRKTEKLETKIDDSGQTASLGSLTLTSATDNLTTKADAESYSAAIKIGKRF